MKLFIFCCFIIVTLVISVVKPDCLSVDPPNLPEKLYNLRLQNELIVSSRERKTGNSNRTIFIGRLSNFTCPNSLEELGRENNGQTEDSTENRLFSTCPTYEMMDYNANRFPTILPGKRCRCSQKKSEGCLREKNRTGKEYECSLLSIKVLVLMKTGDCEGEYAKYAPFWDQQAIGCTCRVSERYFLGKVNKSDSSESKRMVSSRIKQMTAKESTTFETTMKKFSQTTKDLNNITIQLFTTLSPPNSTNANLTTEKESKISSRQSKQSAKSSQNSQSAQFNQTVEQVFTTQLPKTTNA